jgi:hypothetical protein
MNFFRSKEAQEKKEAWPAFQEDLRIIKEYEPNDWLEELRRRRLGFSQQHQIHWSRIKKEISREIELIAQQKPKDAA